MTVLLVLLGLLLLAGIGELAPRFLASRWASARGVDLGTTRARRAAHRIDSLLLDAVGTVTDGELDVIGLDPVEPEHEQNLRWFAGALAHALPDPVGRAVAQLAARGRLSNVEISAAGIAGSVDRHPVRVGRPDWIGVEDTGGLGHRVAVEVDQRLLGRITVAASVRDDAADAVRRLAGLGIESFLVADEPSRDTDRLADAAGIASRWGATAPEKRGRLVAELQEQGRVVAMVGASAPQPEAHAQADLAVGDGPEADLTMRDLDVSLVADTFTLLRSLRRVLAVSRVIVLVTVLLVLPLMLLATLPWSVTAGVVGGGLVMVVVATTATTPPLRRATTPDAQ